MNLRKMFVTAAAWSTLAISAFAQNPPPVNVDPFFVTLDVDGDVKVSHAEWEKIKNDTVFKPYRWPQYNRNRDEWITVDEAPKAPSAK